jgi:CBS domain-containing protein
MPERLDITAKQIMLTDVPTLRMDASISEAIDLLADKEIACAVVIDESDKPQGIITERDLLALAEDLEGTHLATVMKRMLQEEHHIFDAMRGLRNMAATTVSDIASRPLKCAEADMTIGQLASIMETFDYRQLPVLKDGRLVGLVGRQEIIRAIADKA